MTTPTVHPVDEVLPVPRLAALGLQHVLVMYAGAVAVPLIVGRALKLNPADLATWAGRFAATRWDEVHVYFMHEPTAPGYAASLLALAAAGRAS